MQKGGLGGFCDGFISLEQILQIVEQLLSVFHLTHVYLGLFSGQLLFVELLRQLVKDFKVFLDQLFVLLVLEPLVSRQRVIAVQVGIPDLVYYVFANDVHRATQLCLDQREVAEYRLL